MKTKTKTKTNKQTPAALSFPRWLALALALAVTLIGGALYGSLSQRWGAPPDLAAAGAHVSEMPRQIGSWSLVEDLPMEQSALDMLECAGYVNRRYVDQESGRAILVALLVGPPGPIAVHTPEVCFSSRNYDRQDERTASDDPVGRSTAKHLLACRLPYEEPVGGKLARLLRLEHRGHLAGLEITAFRIRRGTAAVQDPAGDADREADG